MGRIQLPGIIAHRGASDRAPENTLLALREAASQGATWVECDVIVSQDHQLVVCHDETVNRTTNGKGRVSQLPYSALSQLDAGSWFSQAAAGERMPLLSEWIGTAESLGLQLNVELKGRCYRDVLVDQAAHLLAESQQRTGRPYLVSSFQLATIVRYATRFPEQPYAINFSRWPWRFPRVALKPTCYSWHFNAASLTAKRVRYAKARGKSVVAYTVDEVDVAARLFAMGVDAIFSNNMELIQQFGADKAIQ